MLFLRKLITTRTREIINPVEIATGVENEPTELILVEQDKEWLDSFRIDYEGNTEYSDKKLQEIIRIGSIHINEDTNKETKATIMQARYDFYYGYLGVENEDHPLRKSFDSFINTTNKCIIPIDTFINTQRTLSELGVDGAKVVNKLPTALCYAPDSVREKMEKFAELGIDGAKVVNKHTVAIGLAPESVRKKMQNFTELGIDGAKVVNKYPSAIGFAPESVRIKFRTLKHAGVTVEEMSIEDVCVVLITPNEIVLSYLANRTQTNKTLGAELQQHKKIHNLTNLANRNEHFEEQYPELPKQLGIHALELVRYKDKKLTQALDNPPEHITQLEITEK